jgi:hypothetical protein
MTIWKTAIEGLTVQFHPFVFHPLWKLQVKIAFIPAISCPNRLLNDGHNLLQLHQKNSVNVAYLDLPSFVPWHRLRALFHFLGFHPAHTF